MLRALSVTMQHILSVMFHIATNSSKKLATFFASFRHGFEELSAVHHLAQLKSDVLNWQSCELKQLSSLQKVCRLQACFSDTTRNSLLIVLKNTSVVSNCRQCLDI